MYAKQPIPPFCDTGRDKEPKKDIIVEEFHRQKKKLNAEKQKNRKLKRRYKKAKAQWKQAERAMAQERSDARRREMIRCLQTKFDDLIFYCGNLERSGELR